ncbi:interleukin-17 receptor C isoform X3 [Monodelphis domestica]|uniref:interleukin-17 receptor C isoform X3 n=1 Tax=Monodelphis domestica TaxID=13616 RepID=UPI0024E1D42B|nr:interleukin-17 receptor C isoform X3 [Monodelphis domestica]
MREQPPAYTLTDNIQKMTAPWILLFFVLGGWPWVLSLEKLKASPDVVQCYQGLSCRLKENDFLCLLGGIEPIKDPVLVPTKLQTEVVLQCREESNCDLCVRVTLYLTVQEPRKEDPDEGGLQEDAELTSGPWPRNESLEAEVILSFKDFLSNRCVLVEVEVSPSMVQPGQNVGYLVFDCFRAPVGDEVWIWSYTQPRYQKELNHTQQLPDCIKPELWNNVQSCWVLPWFNISAEGDAVQLVMDVSAEQNYVLFLYWNQTQGLSTRFHEVLTGPHNITVNNTDLVPCLCIQMWPNVLDAIRNSHCPFQKDPRAHKNLWNQSKLNLTFSTLWGETALSWMVKAPCPLSAEMVLCWQPVGSELCHPLPLPLPRENVIVNTLQHLPMLTLHPNICLQVWSRGKPQIQKCPPKDVLGPLRDDMLLLETWGSVENHSFCAMEISGCTPLPSLAHTRAAFLGKQLLQDLQSGQCVQLWNATGTLWACSLQKYTHHRWVLAWLAFLALAACILLLLLLNRDGMKGWLQFLKEDYRYGGAARGRRALLLYSPDHPSFERLVGTLASALGQLQLSVAVDLWHRQELSALGPLAWFHAQRRQALQEGGVVILIFSPGAVALCREWLQEVGAPRPPAPTPDTFAASLSCVLPDFLEGRASGCYVVACFEELLPPECIPDLFHSVPVFSLPSQTSAFLRALVGPGKGHRDTVKAHATRMGQYLQPALEECLQLGASSSL